MAISFSQRSTHIRGVTILASALWFAFKVTAAQSPALQEQLVQHQLALKSARQAKDAKSEGTELQSLGDVSAKLGANSEAADFYTQAETIFDRNHLDLDRRDTLHELGKFYQLRYQPNTALKHFTHLRSHF